MIDEVSSRIKSILKQQETPHSPFLSKIKSPSHDNSISSNKSLHYNQSARISSTQQATKNLFPPPKSRQSSRVLENKETPKSIEKPKQNSSLIEMCPPHRNNAQKKQRFDIEGKFQFLGTFNENSMRLKSKQSWNQNNRVQTLPIEDENEEDEYIEDRSLLQEMIEENNRKFVMPALEELQEKINLSIVSKIHEITPEILKFYFQESSAQPNKTIKNQTKQPFNPLNIESVYYQTPLNQKNNIIRSSENSAVEQLLFTPKIPKYTQSIQSLNFQNQMHEQLMLQRQMMHKYHGFMSTLSAKIAYLEKQIVNLRSYMIDSKEKMGLKKGTSDESLKSIKKLSQKINFLQQKIGSISQRNIQKQSKGECSKETLQYLQKTIMKSIVNEVIPKSKCPCQTIIDEILKSQKHLMAELKYIKHFSKGTASPIKEKSTARFNENGVRQSRKKMEVSENCEDVSVIKKLQLYCRSGTQS